VGSSVVSLSAYSGENRAQPSIWDIRICEIDGASS
jgi:hypothetical protein